MEKIEGMALILSKKQELLINKYAEMLESFEGVSVADKLKLCELNAEIIEVSEKKAFIQGIIETLNEEQLNAKEIEE